MDLNQEKILVDSAKTNPEAFGALFDEYYSKILGYSIKRTGDVHLAEDITAETFYKAQRKLWQFKWQGVPFSAWLYRIATNEINYYFRTKKRHNSISLEALTEDGNMQFADQHNFVEELQKAEDELMRHEIFLKVKNEINKLPIKYQEVIALRFFENKTISEIAQILNKKDGTIKSLLSRGIKRLRVATEEQMQPSLQKNIMKGEGSINNQ